MFQDKSAMFVGLRQAAAMWIINKIQEYGPHRVSVLEKTYEISKDVFNPKFYYTSEFMAGHIQVTPEDEVLDMGTGSGILAITAGEKASRVVAIDISPEAVQYAQKNVIAHGLEKVVTVLRGDLFSPLGSGDKFSIILFTPPYMKCKPRTGFERALCDPEKKLARRFFDEAKAFLKPDGYVQMLYSTIAEPEQVLKIAGERGWRYSIMAQKKTVAETFSIYRLAPHEYNLNLEGDIADL